MKWTKEQQERFEKFILGDDMDFYEEYTIHLTDEEQKKFFAENPEFMSEYPVSRLGHCGGFQLQAGYMQIWEGRVPSKNAVT